MGSDGDTKAAAHVCAGEVPSGVEVATGGALEGTTACGSVVEAATGDTGDSTPRGSAACGVWGSTTGVWASTMGKGASDYPAVGNENYVEPMGT